MASPAVVKHLYVVNDIFSGCFPGEIVREKGTDLISITNPSESKLVILIRRVISGH